MAKIEGQGHLSPTKQNSCILRVYTHNRGLLVCVISWFVTNPFIFNVLLGKNDVGYKPRTSSPHPKTSIPYYTKP